MTNTILLRSIIDDSGMTITAIAKKCGIARGTLYNKLAGKGEFTASEIASLTTILFLSKKERDDIFFAKRLH